MESAIIVSFRHLERSDAYIARARELAHRLTRLNARITHCHIAIEGQRGSPYQVRIELNLPGAHIHADSRSGHAEGHAEVYPALRAAFSDARRQLIALGSRQLRARFQPPGLASARGRPVGL